MRFELAVIYYHPVLGRSILAYSSPLSKLLFIPGYGRNVPANTCQASSDLATRLRMM